jgi:hypothetical protein
MEKSRLTINKVYDKYDAKDFSYGEENSTNLNPKREISFDKLDRIALKLQEVTDDIIRKRIEPSPDPEPLIRGPMGETVPQGIPLQKQKLLVQTGSIGNALLFPALNDTLDPGPIETLLERMIGTFPVPELLSDFDSPIALDCDEILRRFDIFDDEDDDEEDDDDDPGGFANRVDEENNCAHVWGPWTVQIEPDIGIAGEENRTCLRDLCGDIETRSVAALDGPPTEGDEEDENSPKECAEIELTWLKIILLLVRFLNWVKRIINFVLSILVPLIDILRLAVGAWINPPCIATIIQMLIELVTAIILFLITQFIQFVWNLLNLDCVSDQLASIIAQIRRALSVFASVMNAFSPDAINLLVDKVNREVMDPLSEIMEEAQAKREAWAQFANEMRDFWGRITEEGGLKALGKEMMSEVGKGVAGGLKNDPNVSKAMGLGKDVMNTINDAKRIWLEGIQGIQDAAALIGSMKIDKRSEEFEMMASKQFNFDPRPTGEGSSFTDNLGGTDRVRESTTGFRLSVK